MTTRHAEIRVWSAYRDELTSWLCLLDDRFADELQEAESAVSVEQSKLDVGKAARSSKLWFLLKQSMSKFQRAQDLIRLIEHTQKGASAGYEFWHMLNKELSVRSKVEGQALREQAFNLYPPKYLKPPSLNFQKEHQNGGYFNAFGAGTGDKGDKGKGKKGDKGKGKGEGKEKKGKGKGDKDKTKGKDRGGGASSAARAKSKAKKTDVCHNCGAKGHWARDCLVRPLPSPRTKATAPPLLEVRLLWERCWKRCCCSQNLHRSPRATSPPRKGMLRKGSGKGVRTLLEGAYFAMPSVALHFVQPEDKIFWLLDSGSSYHVVSKETLETGHVKILS